MNIGINRLLVSLPVILLVTGCRTMQEKPIKPVARSAPIKSVAVLPCQYHESLVNCGGFQDQTSVVNVRSVDQCLQRSIGDHFRARKWTVVDGRLRQKETTAGTNKVEQTRRAWMQKQLPLGYQSLTASAIRPEGPLLAEYEGADAVLFTTITVVWESAEAATSRRIGNTCAFILGLLSGSSSPPFHGSPERKTINVVLVDGRNGECLWRRSTEFENPGGRGLDDAVERLFRK